MKRTMQQSGGQPRPVRTATIGEIRATARNAVLATICADHTRRLQLLFQEFWTGNVNMWIYRKKSRELTQQFVNELEELINQDRGIVQE